MFHVSDPQRLPKVSTVPRLSLCVQPREIPPLKNKNVFLWLYAVLCGLSLSVRWTLSFEQEEAFAHLTEADIHKPASHILEAHACRASL